MAYCDQILGLWVVHVEVPNSSNIFRNDSIFVKFKFLVLVLRLVPRLYSFLESLIEKGRHRCFNDIFSYIKNEPQG